MTEGSFRPKRELPVWKQVPGSSGITIVDTEFKVEDLNADKAYTFRVGMARDGEDLDSCLAACYVYSDPGEKKKKENALLSAIYNRGHNSFEHPPPFPCSVRFSF